MTTMLSLEKIKDLWSNLSSVRLDEEKRQRASVIFETVDAMLSFELSEDMFMSAQTALLDDCPTDNSNLVRDNVRRKANEYFGEYGERCLDLLWNRIAVIQNRKEWSRTASEAKPKSEWESTNTSPTFFSNPDSWFFSYNYPWHIIRWFQETSRNSRSDVRFSDWEGNGDGQQYKFLLKYLWMLSKDDELSIVPILSLRSFFNLVPVFHELSSSFERDFHFQNGKWSMTDEEFREKWPTLSKSMLQAVLGRDVLSNKEEKRRFSTFLFVTSLTDLAGKDLRTMLEGGNRAVILYGPPGTGKTFTAKSAARTMLGIPVESNAFSSDNGEFHVVQFHPNYTYQDFVGGIFPRLDKDEKEISYKRRPGIFKLICDEAAKPENEGKKFILIIDEINRADLSAVFGELLYGLEYRNEPMTIPVFDDPFRIPPNVYLIGTMNNTDKSLIGFDLALRRRFGFMKVLPNMDVLAALPLVFSETGPDETDVDPVLLFIERARNLNKGLMERLGLSEDKAIGHAYFLKIKDVGCKTIRDEEGGESFVLTPYAMERLWDYHIEPLLEEYLGLDFEARSGEVAAMKTEFCKSFFD